jgi:cytochrome bd-type quinol oxidase subunit 2
MAAIIYGTCALLALLCAVLLLLAYRRSRYRLLLWSGLCFVGLTANNVLLIVDKLVYPNTDLSVSRSAVSLVSLSLLLFGLIWDAK